MLCENVGLSKFPIASTLSFLRILNEFFSKRSNMLQHKKSFKKSYLLECCRKGSRLNLIVLHYVRSSVFVD